MTLPVKIHNDDLAPRHVQKAPHVPYDFRERCDANYVVVDPESVRVVALLVESGAVRYRWIISNPDIQVPYAVHQLRPHVAILRQQVPLKGVPSRQVAVLVAAGIVCPGYHQATDGKPAELSPSAR